jgi:hypothetical protein
MIRSPEAVAEIRQMKEQQAQQMQMAQMAMEAAKTVPALGKEVEEGSPLSMLTGLEE